MRFSSERLIFRQTGIKDYHAIKSVLGNEEVMRYTTLDCIKEDARMRKIFRAALAHRNGKLKWYLYMIFEKESMDFVGVGDIELEEFSGKPEIAEIGYLLLPQFWGKGYATEAAGMMLEISFQRFGVRKTNARCNAMNIQSEKIMRKCGMKKEGVIRCGRFKNGQWYDELCYGILREEWR
jgi:ribosomal-protein-alanine N-acetyltransferase